VTLHPLLLPCVPLVVGVLVGRAVGCFHRRGWNISPRRDRCNSPKDRCTL